MKKCYDAKYYINMGYVCCKNSWSQKVEGDIHVIHSFTKPADIPSSSYSGSIFEKISDFEAKVGELKDLLVANHS